MSPIKLRRLFSRCRSRVALIVAVAALGGAVAVHHTPLDTHGMAGMTAVMCLAVLGAATLVAAALHFLARVRPRSLNTRIPGTRRVPAARRTPARAGPLYLLLQVLRR